MQIKETINNSILKIENLNSKYTDVNFPREYFSSNKEEVKEKEFSNMKSMLLLCFLTLLLSYLHVGLIAKFNSVPLLIMSAIIMYLPMSFAIMINMFDFEIDEIKKSIKNSEYIVKEVLIWTATKFVCSLFLNVITGIIALVILKNSPDKDLLFSGMIYFYSIIIITATSFLFVFSYLTSKNKYKHLKTNNELEKIRKKYDEELIESEKNNDLIDDKVNAEIKEIAKNINSMNDYMYLELIINECELYNRNKTQILELTAKKFFNEYNVDNVINLKKAYLEVNNKSEIINI